MSRLIDDGHGVKDNMAYGVTALAIALLLFSMAEYGEILGAKHLSWMCMIATTFQR